jgi:hypothetical protein
MLDGTEGFFHLISDPGDIGLFLYLILYQYQNQTNIIAS